MFPAIHLSWEMKALLFLPAFMLAVTPVFHSQEIYQKTCGGDGFGYGYVLRITSGGGFIIGGINNSFRIFAGQNKFIIR